MHRHCDYFTLIFHIFCCSLSLAHMNWYRFRLISTSFGAIMRADMPYFPGTTISHIIAISCRRLDICSNICCLIPRALHILWILIGLKHPSEKFFPPSYIPKALFKNSSCGPDTAINWTWTIQRIFWVDKHCWWYRSDEPLHNGSTCVPTSLIHYGGQRCFQVIHYQLIWGVSFPNFSFLFPGRKYFGAKLNPGPTTNVLYWDFTSSCDIGYP